MSADYPEQVARTAGKTIASPFVVVRKDDMGDLASADGYFALLQASSDGGVRVNQEGGKATYSAAIVGLVAVASCTDLLLINGSATKTVRILEVRFSAVATGAKTLNARGVVRSAANTGGTATNPTAVPHSSNDGAATAVVSAYTANPTQGAINGAIRAVKYNMPAVDVSSTADSEIVWDFRGSSGGKGLRLEGVAEGFALNLNGESAGSGNVWNASITWTEGPTTE